MMSLESEEKRLNFFIRFALAGVTDEKRINSYLVRLSELTEAPLELLRALHNNIRDEVK